MTVGADHYTKHGAHVLALTIQKYWHDRGHRGVVVERFEVFPAVGEVPATWGVRSNLVNGLPPVEAAQEAA